MFKAAFLSIFIISISLFANTDNRKWELADGTKFSAALMTYDSQKKIAVLKDSSGKTREIHFDDMGLVDKAWIKKFQNLQGEMAAVIKEEGGKYEVRKCKDGEYETTYYVYYPSNYVRNKNIPLILLFHPGGQGQRFLLRHIRAAERAGIIAICPDTFRNNNGRVKGLEKELDTRFNDLYADIKKNIKFDQKRFLMGGSSGGALRAYHYAADFAPECFGVYANGGWLGNSYSRPYPAMRVAMANGHKDNAANNYVEPDSKDLKAKGSVVRMFAFEGGHQTAPTETQFKAFTWMLEQSQFYDGFTDDLESMRKTTKFDGDKTVYSSKGAHNVAFKIFKKVDFKGMAKPTVLLLLGNTSSLNEFALVSEKNLDSPLIYFFADGEDSSAWIINFKHGKVESVVQHSDSE